VRLGEEKKIEEEGKKLQRRNIMAPLLHRAAIIKKRPHDENMSASATQMTGRP